MTSRSCWICWNLLSYHNNLWSCISNHILSDNLWRVENIVAATAHFYECEANSDPLPVHASYQLRRHKRGKPPNDVDFMKLTFLGPSYGPNMAAYYQMWRTVSKWNVVDFLPYRTVVTLAFKTLVKYMDLMCHDFGRKSVTLQVRNWRRICFVCISGTFLSFFGIFYPQYM